MADAEELPPADQLAITGLLARYCVLLDLVDVDGWVGLFTTDAGFDIDGRTYRGHDGLRRLMRTAQRGTHLANPPVIEALSPDRVRTTRNALFVNRHSAALRHTLYRDEVVRTADGWRIQSVVCRFVTGDGLVTWPEPGCESPVHGIDIPDWADA
ncbi:nuclear transport factor 2 family protein [Frankia sp. AgB1.9]|uniref:nuclear transport factor 2 family protein n=1 Tax=unclassified Frankia TaxID=2632575 RepID=UPI001933DEDC|nr:MULTISPECIES: nuclear transport factor 2 family protein [unclassified Frankia]MBL7490487.1 nuclear transport factor 2 family protein [Frankia sp. AgW1.1]MBL7552083.1 nuclear transport factor 2 family protein [Frankia sp. AgB1.9]MBL7620588.1 nuclear transport factor 2 family protein [Frankia sp. AgB1.8]